MHATCIRGNPLIELPAVRFVLLLPGWSAKIAKMALLRAAKDQLLAGKAAPWLHAGLRNVCRSFAAQAEPLEDEEGVYVVTGPAHKSQSTCRVVDPQRLLLPCIIHACSVYSLVFRRGIPQCLLWH